MKCTHPLYAIDYGYDEVTGKRKIELAPKRPDTYNLASLKAVHGANLITLPCGHCLACKVNYTHEWSVRCMLEASLYTDNWFLTLTYDDDHLPSDHKLNKRDVQLFIKSLRKVVPGLRFFCSGEYGESGSHRPHYHLILFNCAIPDIKFVSKGRLGGHYFDSKLVSSIWSKGQITLGYVTQNSCEYVARYCLKKIDGTEFLLMSLKPGIGGRYALDHFKTIYDTDAVYVKGQKFKVPRYFDKLLEKFNEPLFLAVTYRRSLSLGNYRQNLCLSSSGFDCVEQMYDYQSRANIDKFRDKLKKGCL